MPRKQSKIGFTFWQKIVEWTPYVKVCEDIRVCWCVSFFSMRLIEAVVWLTAWSVADGYFFSRNISYIVRLCSNFRNLVGQTIIQSSLQTIRSRSRLQHFIAAQRTYFISRNKSTQHSSETCSYTHSLTTTPTRAHEHQYNHCFAENGLNLFIWLRLLFRSAARQTVHTGFKRHFPYSINMFSFFSLLEAFFKHDGIVVG